MTRVYEVPDPLLNKEAYLNENARRIHAIVSGVDQVAIEMEKKWGCGKLERFVSPKTAEGFELARMSFDNALRSGVIDDIRQKGDNLIKGWRYLDNEATQLGREPAAPTVWHITGHDGARYAICHDADAVDLVDPVEGVTVMTLLELLRFYESDPNTRDWVRHVKGEFEGATVTSVKRTEVADDELPF
jgi:hypothetical protein